MAGKVYIELSEDQVKQILIQYLEWKVNGNFDVSKVRIETKSKQNYRAEWERADFRVIYESSEI